VRILFVCLGNTCRSPFAEALGRRLAVERGLDVEFASAGEFACEGDQCPEDAVDVAKDYGVDLSSYTARRLTSEQTAAVDKLVRLFDVSDPKDGGPAAYRRAYQQLHEKVEELLAEVGR
jgi:protein-tyrosine-phosphatase